MATSRHRLPWIQMFLCVSAILGTSLAQSPTDDPETTVPLTTTVIPTTAAPVSDSTVANNEVDLSMLTGSHDNRLDTSATSHSPKSDNVPVTTVTKAPPEVFTVTIPAPKTRSRQPSTEAQTRAVREVTMVTDVFAETVTRETKVITGGISTVTMDTTSTTSYDDESDKIINPTTLIIMDPTSAVAMEASEESLITSSVSLETDAGNLDLSTHLYDNELSTLSSVTMETDRDILGTSPEDVTTVTISDKLTTHSLSSTEDLSVTTETEYSTSSFYVTTETATLDQYFYGNRSTADYNSNEVCTITNLTHIEVSRTDTTLTFSWAVDNQDCSSLEICISPAPTSGARCQDVTTVTPEEVTFTDLTPGTTHTANLTVIATDGVTNSSTATGKTALSPPTNVTLQRGSPSQSVVRVTWLEPAGNYDRVRVDCVNGTTNNISGSVPKGNTTYDCTGLTAGTLYTVTVTTTQTGNHDVSAATTAIYTGLNPPTAVTVSPDPVQESTSLTVAWTAPVGGYTHVTGRCVGVTGGTNATFTATSGVTSMNCTGLTPGGVYEVTLTASISSAVPAPPPDSTATAPQQAITVPSPPTVQITTQTTTSLTVSVARGPGQCSGFHVYYSSWQPDGDDGGTETLACSDGSPQQVVLSSLLTNAQYNVSASVISNTDGTLEAIEGNNATTDAWTKPAWPQTPTLDNVGPRWLLVEWTAAANNPDNVAYYDVRVTTNEDSPRADCYRVKGPASDLVDLKAISCTCNNTVITLPDPAFSLNVSGVTPYTAHTVTVTTVNPGVCSETSTAVTRTTDEDFPGAPANVTVLPYPTYLELSWSPPPEPNGVIVSYEVRWCDTGTVPTRAQDCYSDVVNTTEYRVEGLVPYKCYNVTVAANTSVGQGPALQGFEDGVSKDPCTKAGPPQFLAQTTARAQTAFTINITWSLVEGAVPTGNVTYYNVTATSGTAPSTHTRVKGFNTSSAVLSGLEPYELYIVCVIAQTEDQNGKILQIETPEADHCTPTRTLDWYPTVVSSFAVQNGQNAQKCHTFSLTWSEPADTNGVLQQYVVTYRKTSDPPGTERTENFEGTKLDGQIDCVDPNDAEYAFKIQAANENYRGNVTEMSASSGICPPSSVTKPGFSKDNVAESQSTVTVPIDRCSLCYNNNGDVSFVAVIVTAESINAELSEEYTRANFDQVFRSVESYNESVGYRATPDDFKELVNCTGYREMCRQADPTAPCTSARATRAANEVPPYDFVIGDKLGCDSGQYCNKPLKDGTKYRVRVAAEVNGKVNVSPSSVEVVTDANMAWVAGVVIALLVVIAAVVVGVIFMKKRKQGPFRERHQQTRPVRPTDMGSINPGFAGIDEPLIERPCPVPVSSFLAHFEEHARDSDLLFAEEYKLIQELSPKHSVDASEHPSNRLKNRFTNILPFDHSRVKLLPADDDDCSDYINANYMPGYNSKREFIASQGPMKSTTEDYWRMVWEQNVAMIVMVTQLEERGRERCAKYWPNDNEPMYYGDLQVQMRSESVLDAYVIRILDIRLGEVRRTISQFHYVLWPDFGVPRDPDSLVNFVLDVRSHIRPNNLGPVIVHCSAGVGRTGSFIAVDRLLQHIKENQTIDIFGIVLEMRNNRSFMIQVEAQYVLVHKCVVKALERGLHRQRPFNQPEPDDDQAIYANQNYLPEDNENIYENAQMAEHGV